MVSIQRKAAIFSRGVFTRFPYQVNTHGLPAEVISENLVGYVEAIYGEKGRELRERDPRNFEEFILRYMGEGFAKNFMVPYNQKLWTVHPRELSAAWVGRFVPRPSLKEVVDGALGAGSDQLGLQRLVPLPARGRHREPGPRHAAPPAGRRGARAHRAHRHRLEGQEAHAVGRGHARLLGAACPPSRCRIWWACSPEAPPGCRTR